MDSYHLIVLYMVCGALVGCVLSLREENKKMMRLLKDDFLSINHLYKQLNELKEKLK